MSESASAQLAPLMPSTSGSFSLSAEYTNASTGVGELAILNRQREEVDAFLGVGRSGCGCQHGVVAAGGESGAGRLLGHAAGLELDVLSAGKLYGNVLLHMNSSSSLCLLCL